jgi:hypothetical protein
MANQSTTTLCETDRRLAMARHQVRAGLSLLGFAMFLPVTLMSSSFSVSLVGALGLFFCGMVAGYQAARIGVVAGRNTSTKD